MRKIIFLDIDGTLISFNGSLSEKTREALKRAKEAGHTLMLCTGRTRCQIQEELLSEGLFDGMVAAAGAYIEYEGKEIYRKTIEPKLLERLVRNLKQENVALILMEKEHLYSSHEDWEVIKSSFERQIPGALEKLEETMGNVVLLENYNSLPIVEKVIFEDAPCPFEQVVEAAGASFDVIPSSFHQEVVRSGEISNAGVTKATGIERVLTHLEMKKEDTVAFGDSYNDIEMLDFAAVGVAMGNAPEDVKKAADMVTEDVDKDGLYLGFEKLGLI